MKKAILAVLLCTIMVMLCGCKSGDYKKATKLMQNGDYEEAATAYHSLGDYKDSKERATMLEVKVIMERYQEFSDEMVSLSMVNYDTVLAPLLEIIDTVNQLDIEEIEKYGELNEYVRKVKAVNDGILGVIEIDHDAISKFQGPGFFMFPSSMELTLRQSELLYRSWLKELLEIEFPYDYLFR